MKQNKQDKLKQYIEEALENKKERKIKKRYIIFLSLFIHIVALLIIFFLLEYSKQDYFSDLFKKPAQVKFQQSTKQSQTKSQFTQSQNAQAKQQPKIQIEPEKEKIIPKEPEPIKPLNLPTFQGLNKPLPPKNVEKTQKEQDSGISKLFDTKKESVKESVKEEPSPIKTKKQEKSKPKQEEQKPLFNKEEEQEKIEKNKTEKPEQIEKDSLFLRKLKILEKELEQNKKEREKFTQNTQKPEKSKIKKIEETKETEKIDPRSFVVKKEKAADSKQTSKQKEKEHNAWNFSANNNSGNKKTNSKFNDKDVTLTDISKGFLDYTEQQGANLIQYTNAIEGAPTEEQLKHERYIRKIFDCIDTTMKIKSNTLTFHTKVDPNQILTVIVKIILENNGKVSDMKILQSSGFIEFDRFMLNIVNNSSSGFPPVPSYLSKDKYPLPVKFFIPVQMVASRM